MANQEIGVTLDWITEQKIAENTLRVLASAGLATSKQLGQLSAFVEQAHKEDSIYHNTADLQLRELLDVVRDLDEDYLLGLLRSYHEAKMKSFEKENWPYAIDRKRFVDSFDFKSGTVRNWKAHPKAETCVPFLRQALQTSPVVIVANYGMGKTTIAQYLFSTWLTDQLFDGMLPIFVSATNAKLGDYTAESIATRLYEEVMSMMPRPAHGTNNLALDSHRQRLIAKFQRHFENRRICLIFDGADETLYDREEFWGLHRFVTMYGYSILVTCREECQPFIDAFSGDDKDGHVAVNLLDWGASQWKSYTSALKKIHPSKSPQIDSFSDQLAENKFGELPQRPLFLKMLSDLIIFKVQEIEIHEALYGNMAEVYYKYLLWRIKDDGHRKGGVRKFGPEQQFCIETFRLFRLIALDLYKRFSQSGPPDSGAEADTAASKGEIGDRGISLKQIRQLLEHPPREAGDSNDEDGSIILKPEKVEAHLADSTMFATLRRVGDVHFAFSHRSFMEYLVAYDLARFLIRSDGGQPSCTSTWSLFQTVEISKHFMEEVERRRVTEGLTERQRDEQISTAFAVVLRRLEATPQAYSEDVEEVLYYVGKFRLESESLIECLLDVIGDPNRYHRVYVRTAYLALAQCKTDEYCIDYVQRLVSSYGEKDGDFETNRRIQCAYYGEGRLRDRLCPAVERYIQKGQLDQLAPLRVFTFFTAISPANASDAESLRSRLLEVRAAATQHGSDQMVELCSAMERILKEISTF